LEAVQSISGASLRRASHYWVEYTLSRLPQEVQAQGGCAGEVECGRDGVESLLITPFEQLPSATAALRR